VEWEVIILKEKWVLFCDGIEKVKRERKQEVAEKCVFDLEIWMHLIGN